MAKIRIIREHISYFSNFDGIKLDDLSDYFNLSEHDEYGAAWLLNMLQEENLLKVQSVEMMRFTQDEKKWQEHVRCHLEESEEDNKVKQINENDELLKLLSEYAAQLQQIKNEEQILNVSDEVIKSFCNIKDDKTLEKFYNYLVKDIKVLEPYLYNIWRLNAKLDCSLALPACISNHIDLLLTDRFAYTFTLENMCLSLEKEAATTTASPTSDHEHHQIFLPENPFSEFYTDLINTGIALRSRIISIVDNNLEDIDYGMYDSSHAEHIKSIINSSRLKLYDQTDHHMEFTTFSSYLLEEHGRTLDRDLRNMISNGFKLVLTRKKESSSFTGSFLKGLYWCAFKLWHLAKKVGSFMLAVVEFVGLLPGENFLFYFF